jgi:DNA invertase Pin-like site-specific DNA recombinase
MRWRVAETFIEAGVSAKTANRPELIRALEFCRSQRVRYFLVYKIDRFARNQQDHVVVRARLRRYGTDLRSVTEPFDDTAGGEVMEGMLSLFAQYDNRVRTERTLYGMEQRVREGTWVWPAPFGYRRPAGGGNIEPDPTTAPAVRRAFEDYSTGVYSHARLASKLAAEGVRTSTGREPDGQFIYRMLRNPIYCGVIEVWGEQYRGSFLPLISRELFEACQPKKPAESRPHAAPRSLNNPLFPLRGFIRCAECDRPLTGSQSRGKDGALYAYYHHYNRDCALVRWLPKDQLEKTFRELLDQYALSPGSSEAMLTTVRDHIRELRDADARRLAAVRRDLTDLDLERQRIFDHHRAGVYSTEEFLEQKAMVNRRMNEKQLLLERGEAGNDGIVDGLAQVLDVCQRPRATWDELKDSFPERISFQRLMFPKGLLIEDQRLRTPASSAIYELSAGLSGGGNQVVHLLIERWDHLVSEVNRWSAFLNDR